MRITGYQRGVGALGIHMSRILAFSATHGVSAIVGRELLASHVDLIGDISQRLSGPSWDPRWGIDDLGLGHLGIVELSIGVIQAHEREFEVLFLRNNLASVAFVSERIVHVVAIVTDPVTRTVVFGIVLLGVVFFLELRAFDH